MRLENPEDDITLSGELNITITYSFQGNRDLPLSQKLELMEEVERELVEKIKLLDNVSKIIY